jgi:hypothetical protein
VEVAETFVSKEANPDRHFDAMWARSILEDAEKELGTEWGARGQKEKFDEIRPFLAGGSCPDRSALHRARQRFGELVRKRVAATVASAADVDEEVNALFESLRQNPETPA